MNLRLPRILLLAVALVMPSQADTVVELGTVIEFNGPDDLHLDADQAVIAVDVFGDQDRTVNGVVFLSDRPDGGAVEADGVTVTTSATNSIDGWAAAQDYTGADSDSVDALIEIMRDIRWEAAPNPVTVEVEGLIPNAAYEIQLLFNEGADRDRRWDIAVGGELVVDDISSEGVVPDMTWDIDNGFAYVGEFESTAEGTLSIEMAQHIGGQDQMGADNNPILQAFILHQSAPPTAPSDISIDASQFLSTLSPGDVIGNLSSADINGGNHTYTLVAGAGDTNNGLFQIQGSALQALGSFSGLAGRDVSVRIRSTDGDGFSFEKAIVLTVSGDSDADGLLDSWEIEVVGNLEDLNSTGDFDNDGLTDLQEFNAGTAPNDADSDDDGSNDGAEISNNTVPLNADSDGDGLNDGAEAEAGTNPLNADTDNDDLSDFAELTGDPPTDPLTADTDGDGVSDGAEITLGSNPTDPNSRPASDTTIFNGFISEIFGPDDLHLDPATILAAVDVFGDEDREVNGVLFKSDKEGGGEVESDEGILVTTTAANQIDGWAGAPAFTGADPTSASNLSEIMADIRWEAAPSPLLVDIAGLNQGSLYEVQMLFNEGGDRNRQWDIGVEDELVVDNFTSEGDAGFMNEGRGVWSADNSFAYTGVFTPSADGILNIVMQQHIGGLDPMGADNNPILQAIIVHSAAPPRPISITEVTRDANGTTLTWNSLPGETYVVEFVATLAADAEWIGLSDQVESGGESTTFIDDANPGISEGYYRVGLFVPPAPLSTDFENGAGEWTVENVAGDTTWEFGTPNVDDGLTTAASGLNAWGTDLDGDYGASVVSNLRSPLIDLRGVNRPRLSFNYHIDSTLDVEGGQLRFLDQEGEHLFTPETIFSGQTDGWTPFSIVIPAVARDQQIFIEFGFLADEDAGTTGAGWYIDDVLVE